MMIVEYGIGHAGSGFSSGESSIGSDVSAAEFVGR